MLWQIKQLQGHAVVWVLMFEADGGEWRGGMPHWRHIWMAGGKVSKQADDKTCFLSEYQHHWDEAGRTPIVWVLIMDQFVPSGVSFHPLCNYFLRWERSSLGKENANVTQFYFIFLPALHLLPAPLVLQSVCLLCWVSFPCWGLRGFHLRLAP